MAQTQRLKTGRSSQFVDSGSGGGSGGGNIVDVSGATADAYAQILLNEAAAGLLGIGSILNTGGDSLTVKETTIDKFGNTVSVETEVPAGDEYLLDLQTNFDDGGGPAMPPFTSYKVEVKSTTPGSPTNYELHLIDIIPGSGAGGGAAGVSNSILSARSTGANIDFLDPTGGLDVDVLATAVPFVVDVGGTRVILTADTTITVTDDENNFIWIDSTGALGVSPLPCIYAYDEPTGATDQHWFDLGQNQMKVWDGGAFVATSRVFIGYVRADSGNVDARYACEPNLLTPQDRFNRCGDGSLGFLEVTAGTTTLTVGMRNYSAIIVRGTGTVTYADTDGQDAALELRAQGVVVVLGTGQITAKGLGLPGGDGATALGVAAQPGDGGGLGGAGGGGGGGQTTAGADGGGHASGQRLPSRLSSVTALADFIEYWGGGGGGAVSTDGSNGTGNGISTGISYPILFGAGAGGGGGGRRIADAGADGGKGGGLLLFSAASIAISSTASILADGDDGDDAASANGGGGGGGGGGTVLAYSRVFQNDGTFTAVGGTGGAGAGTGHAAGDGADGVAIHIYN